MLTPQLTSLFDWRTRAVFLRNARVYLRNWRTAFLPPALEPVVQFLAFGVGLGAYVGAMTYGGQTVDYASYMAPGMVAYTVFSTPFFESLYSAYVRMFYQKTWDGILATQVELRHIVWGEITWASARGVMNASVVAVVILVMHMLGLVHVKWQFLPLLPLIGFIAGWAFSAFGLIFTALVPNIDHMNYPVFLIGVPLGLVSNTYFPVDRAGPVLRTLSQFNPVYHLSETFRGLLLRGELDRHLGMLALTTAVWLLLSATAAHALIKRRVLGD